MNHLNTWKLNIQSVKTPWIWRYHHNNLPISIFCIAKTHNRAISLLLKNFSVYRKLENRFVNLCFGSCVFLNSWRHHSVSTNFEKTMQEKCRMKPQKNDVSSAYRPAGDYKILCWHDSLLEHCIENCKNGY